MSKSKKRSLSSLLPPPPPPSLSSSSSFDGIGIDLVEVVRDVTPLESGFTCVRLVSEWNLAFSSFSSLGAHLRGGKVVPG